MPTPKRTIKASVVALSTLARQRSSVAVILGDGSAKKMSNLLIKLKKTRLFPDSQRPPARRSVVPIRIVDRRFPDQRQEIPFQQSIRQVWLNFETFGSGIVVHLPQKGIFALVQEVIHHVLNG